MNQIQALSRSLDLGSITLKPEFWFHLCPLSSYLHSPLAAFASISGRSGNALWLLKRAFSFIHMHCLAGPVSKKRAEPTVKVFRVFTLKLRCESLQTMSRSGHSGFLFSQDTVAGTEQHVPITDSGGPSESVSLCLSQAPDGSSGTDRGVSMCLRYCFSYRRNIITLCLCYTGEKEDIKYKREAIISFVVVW